MEHDQISHPAGPSNTSTEFSDDPTVSNLPPDPIPTHNQRRSTGPVIPPSLLRRLEGPSSNKAGLLRDPAEVAKIIYECSKGSKYFANEQAKDARLTSQIEALRIKLERQLATRKGNLEFEAQEAQRMFEALEKTRVLNQVIVCVDADAFFCSVEELHKPSLKGKAFAVGSGVLATASYEARKWGCRSAMAGYIAIKLCPHLIFVEPDHSKYQAASESIMNILRNYDPNLSLTSLDECYMNLTAYCRDHDLSAGDATTRVREHVLRDTGLTLSAGIGPNAMIAKIAADINKPNGQFECPPTREGVMNLMKGLPVRKVPGIGRVTERWLEVMNVKTCGDIWDQKAPLLLMRSEVGFDLLIKAYLGLGQTDIKPRQRESRQSVGCESSFKSISKKQDLFRKLKELSEELAAELSQLKFAGRTLTLKIKLDTYEVLSRSIITPILGQKLRSSAEDMYKHATLLLEREIESRHSSFDRGQQVPGCGGARELSIRLLGLKISHLQDQAESSTSGESSLKRWIVDLPASDRKTAKGEPHDDQDDTSKWRCPICNLQLTNDDLIVINEHLDICLWKSSEEGKQAQEERNDSTGQRKKEKDSGSKKRLRIDDDDRRHQQKINKPSKREVQRAEGSTSTDNKNTQVVSILNWCRNHSTK